MGYRRQREKQGSRKSSWKEHVGDLKNLLGCRSSVSRSKDTQEDYTSKWPSKSHTVIKRLQSAESMLCQSFLASQT